MPSTNTLRPIIPDNACPSRITAAAGTKLAGTFHQIISLFYLINKLYNKYLLSSFIQYYWIKLSLIVQNSPLLAIKPEPCLSFSVIVRSLKPIKNHQLGKPLPYQLLNSV